MRRSPILFTEIDSLLRADHSCLEAGDSCVFIHEYTSGQGYQYSDANSFIQNLKKSPEKRDRHEWKHKDRAIRRAIVELTMAFQSSGLDKLGGGVLVPVPPSKVRSDPLYDDRLVRVASGVATHVPAVVVRELLVQRASTPAYHTRDGERRNPAQIASNWYVDEALVAPAPSWLGVLDDVITTGAHFRAAEQWLRRYFPHTPLVGLFIARRRFADPFDDGELDAFFRR